MKRSPRLKQVSKKRLFQTRVSKLLIVLISSGIILSGLFYLFSPKQTYTYQGTILWKDNLLPADSIKVLIYLDKDHDGKVSEADKLVDSLYTDNQGRFEWQSYQSKHLVVKIESSETSEPLNADAKRIYVRRERRISPDHSRGSSQSRIIPR